MHHPVRTTRARRPVALLAGAVVTVLVLSGCQSSTQTKVLGQVNAERQAAKKAAYAANDAAMAKAQRWSAHMASTGVVEHTGGGTKIDPSGLPSWCAIGENVGKGTTTQAVHAAFMRSSIHRANILGPYDHAGTGVTSKDGNVYVVEIFYRAC